MRHRLTVLLVTPIAFATCAFAPFAGAQSVKTSCNLLTPERKGDAGRVLPSPPALDIVGGDFATGTRTVVATLKIDSFDFDLQATPSALYDVLFNVGGVSYAFEMERQSAGSETYTLMKYVFSESPRHLPVAGSLNLKTNTVTWTTSRSNVRELTKRPRQTISDVRALTANRYYGGASDVSDLEHTYVDRTPSCLKPR